MFRCCAPYFSLFVLLSLGARAQNSVPQSTPESTSATANGYDDAAYRKLDQTLSFFRGRRPRSMPLTPRRVSTRAVMFRSEVLSSG